MGRVMMLLGVYRFSVATSAYQELQRSTSYNWARQPRLGKNDALQYVGPGADNITLRGVNFTELTGSALQITVMRIQAAQGVPLPLFAGSGMILGLWCVESISERQSAHFSDGVPRRQEWDMSLTRYDGGLGALLSN